MVGNTLEFLRGIPASNVLLWGSRGTGNRPWSGPAQRIRLRGCGWWVEKHDLVDLPDIVDDSWAARRFIILR
jgi:predicted AAA+ superfamily ATPase